MFISDDLSMKAVFNNNEINILWSILAIGGYIWYLIVVYVIIYWIKLHIEKQVVVPFNSLFEKIWSLIINPMIIISAN